MVMQPEKMILLDGFKHGIKKSVDLPGCKGRFVEDRFVAIEIIILGLLIEAKFLNFYRVHFGESIFNALNIPDGAFFRAEINAGRVDNSTVGECAHLCA